MMQSVADPLSNATDDATDTEETSSAASSLSSDASRTKRRRDLVEFGNAAVAEQQQAVKKSKRMPVLSADAAHEAKIAMALARDKQMPSGDASKLVPHKIASATRPLRVEKITKKRPGRPGEHVAKRNSSQSSGTAEQQPAFSFFPRRVREAETGTIEQDNAARFDRDRMAQSLRITHLWSERGPLQQSGYYWPNCNLGMNDQTLVRIDWIIDYLSNMLLIDSTPTTLERYKTVFDYGQTAARYRQEFDSLTTLETDDPIARDISTDTVECSDQPYWFDKSAFTARRDNETKMRQEAEPTAAHLADVCTVTKPTTLSRKRRHGSSVSKSGTMSEDDDDDDENDDKISAAEKQASQRRAMLQRAKNSVAENNQQTETLESIADAFSIEFTLLRPMFIADYERKHPHRMSPLHQRLFIGLLNGYEMQHSAEELQTLDVLQVAQRVFGIAHLPSSQWSPKFITEFARQMVAYIVNMLSRVRQKSEELEYVYGEANANLLLRQVYIRRIRDLQWQVNSMMKMLLLYAGSFQQGFRPNVPEHPTLLTSSVISPSLNEPDAYENLTAEQRCLRRFLEKCEDNHYRRHKKCIYAQRFVNGVRTNAYEKLQTIKQFVYTLPDMNLEFAEWSEITKSSRTCENLVSKLENINDPQHLPDLVREQYVWSFRNGIYDGSLDKFWAYDSDEIYHDPQSPYLRTKASARFIDLHFDVDKLMSAEAIRDPCSIKVAAMDHILKWQGLDKATIRWTYGLTGRLYMPIGMFDNWGVVLWIRGVAGTGKSTYSHAVQAVFDPEDVGILSNNVEVPFGLSPLVDKFIIIGSEIKSNCTLGESEFQLMATGDEMALAVKNGDPIMVTNWTASQLYLSNDMPRWADSHGAIQRRIVQLVFAIMVAEKDKNTKLEKLLKKQLDALIVRSCRTYKQLRDEVGDGSVWDKLPESFRKAREAVRRETTVMGAFLEEVLIVDEEQKESGTNDGKHLVFVEDLERLYRHKYQDIAAQKGANRFAKALERDAPSFFHLKVERKDEIDKSQVLRGCRLHLPVARKILHMPQWKPDESSFAEESELRDLIAKAEMPSLEDIEAEMEAENKDDDDDDDDDSLERASLRAEQRFDMRNNTAIN